MKAGSHRKVCLQLAVVLVAASLLAGCGGSSGPELATVEGTVTMDGKPLQDAQVTFRPEQGAPSFGRTDENGYYTLSFTRSREGAEIGKHTVEVSTARSADPDADPPVEGRPETVPARYNVDSELTKTVEAGHNEIPIELSSEGEIKGDPELEMEEEGPQEETSEQAGC